MTILTNPQYAFDPTGRLPANLITSEPQALTGADRRDFYFIVPIATPFFAESMRLTFRTLQGDTRPLVENVDYYFTHYFWGATKSIGKPVYGSITFLKTDLKGTVYLTYQTLGGQWTIDSAGIAQVLADHTHDPRTTTWEQVTQQPNLFPPVDHEYNLIDMVGMSDVKDTLDRMVDAILTQASSAMTQHINAIGNPHHLTAADIGAITATQLQAAVQNAINQSSNTSDSIHEGAQNKFFTNQRVLDAVLTNYVPGTAQPLSAQDTVFIAFQKLMALIAVANTNISNCATANRPNFTGLGSQNLVKLNMVTSPLSIDISQAEAFQVTVKSSGAIGFNTSFVGDMSGRVIEFAVTTINDSTNNAYAIAWPSNVKWVDGTPPPRTTSANAKDYWYFVSEDSGTTWTGSLANANPY